MPNSSFIARHGLYTADQAEAAEATLARARAEGVEMVRMVWPDQHGLVRGKAVSRDAYGSAIQDGLEITMAPFFFDTANAIVFNPFMPGGGFGVPQLSGSPNVTMVPDPTTFKVLPWAPETAWVICDLYMRDGSPFMFAPRTILRTTLKKVHDAGYRMLAGIEMEWYLTRIVDPMLETGSLGAPGTPGDPPKVAPVARGYSYLSDSNLDQIDDVLRPLRKALTALELPLRSMEDEWAPSQVETTFGVLDGMAAADAVLLFRTATKQVCRRAGYLASFMSTPAIDGFYASGWHLHSSLLDADTGVNVMIPTGEEILSDTGRYYVGGSLAHAHAASVFTTQSINGYRRRRPYSLAPDRLTWGLDNRAAMMRVISAPGDPSSHVENRVGEPSANPYLYVAAQAISGIDGVLNKTDPGPITDDPYATDSEVLPTSLEAALDVLHADDFFRREFGDQFVDYLVTMKRSEVDRYNADVASRPDAEAYVAAVTEWEHREYFERF